MDIVIIVLFISLAYFNLIHPEVQLSIFHVHPS